MRSHLRLISYHKKFQLTSFPPNYFRLLTPLLFVFLFELRLSISFSHTVYISFYKHSPKLEIFHITIIQECFHFSHHIYTTNIFYNTQSHNFPYKPSKNMYFFTFPNSSFHVCSIIIGQEKYEVKHGFKNLFLAQIIKEKHRLKLKRANQGYI